ncbi:MAG: ABC transporter, partial [Pusillimonas sp.]
EPTTDRKAQRRQEAEARQRMAGLRKPLDAKLKKVEADMERAGQRLQELNALIADPDFYSDARRDERLKVLEEHGELSKKHAQLEEEWLTLQEEVEALTAE